MKRSGYVMMVSLVLGASAAGAEVTPRSDLVVDRWDTSLAVEDEPTVSTLDVDIAEANLLVSEDEILMRVDELEDDRAPIVDQNAAPSWLVTEDVVWSVDDLIAPEPRSAESSASAPGGPRL